MGPLPRAARGDPDRTFRVLTSGRTAWNRKPVGETRCKPRDSPPPCGVNTIERWSQIPEFEDEREEAAFWASHSLDPRLMNASIQRQTVRESTTITLRFDPQMLSRIKRLARQRYLNYQSMIKQWLAERLEEEVSKQVERSSERSGD